MESIGFQNVPEQGQLVEVRQRRYVVSDIVKSSLPPTTLPGGLETAQHLISLTSVEDDALGEELQVIWEIEPGARTYDQVVLPEFTSGFDSPARLDAFLDAVRWGAASSADVRSLQAPFRSGIDIEDYQLDPLVRAVQMPRVNLLIADDVGLGKTIESGLVVQELLIRHRARRILIVCPTALQIHWRDQMREKFGLEFRIVDSELMKSLRRRRGIHVNPWTHFPRLIASIDFLKRERPMRLFREVLPAELEGIWPDPTGQWQRCPVFRLPPLKGSWSRCVEGLAHPHTGEIRPIVFDHTLVRHRDDVVLVHLNHLLVQMSLRLLRAEVWSREGNKRLHRVTARLVPNHILDIPAVIAHARLVVIGGDSQRLHEEIITAGGEIREGRFRRMSVGQVENALAAGLSRQPAESVKQRLVELWPRLKPSLAQSLEVRLQDRLGGLEKFLADRADKEVTDITAILQELARTIEAELTEPEYVQLALFSRPERE
jgi:hypothetical protein